MLLIYFGRADICIRPLKVFEGTDGLVKCNKRWHDLHELTTPVCSLRCLFCLATDEAPGLLL